MQVDVHLFLVFWVSACLKKYTPPPFVHSFTQFECLNIGIHEYLGQSLNIPKNN